MIQIFEKVIRKNLARQLTSADFPLQYLKFSTVTSGSGMNDKVIFLVFKNRADVPFLCIKTVRNYEAKHAILRNFHNLQKLNALTVGSPHEHLFAKAICLHDDGENVFSVETACHGSSLGRDVSNLRTVVESYGAFQVYAAKVAGQGESALRNLQQMANETVTNSGLNQSDQQKILGYFVTLPSADINLPRIVQHGDVTPDNVLLSEAGVSIVDYDDVGNTDIPGFDLFSLFRRFSRDVFSGLIKEYFPAYFQSIGGTFDIENYRRLLFLYHFIEHTQKKAHNFEVVFAERIISDFEQLYGVDSPA